MPEIIYRNRRAFALENERLQVIVTVEGGHIAAITEKSTGMNPLWTPRWPSMEPSSYDPARHPEYGAGPEAKLLAGILGHNLCLDLFGGPSAEEAAAGMTVHGESSVAPYRLQDSPGLLIQQATFPQAQLSFERRLRLDPGSSVLRITETVENLTAWDRPAAWTQHVTLGAPFLRRGETLFRIGGARSKVIESDFTGGMGLQKTGAEFQWPMCPRRDHGEIDLRVYPSDPASAGYTVTLMTPGREQAFFVAWDPQSKLLFGYVWNQTDFPWLGRWEENHARTNPPWNASELTCGMEFGASPMPETRRAMIDRGTLFGVAGYRWLPARTKIQVDYCAFAQPNESIAESVSWDRENTVWLAAE